MKPDGLATNRVRAIIFSTGLFGLPIAILAVFVAISHHSHQTEVQPKAETMANYFLGFLLISTLVLEIIGVITKCRRVLRDSHDLEAVRREVKQIAFMAVTFIATAFALGISVGRLAAK